jgi:hypothetical protein
MREGEGRRMIWAVWAVQSNWTRTYTRERIAQHRTLGWLQADKIVAGKEEEERGNWEW